MSSAGRKPQTIRQQFNLVGQVLAYAVECDMLAINPATGVKVPKVRTLEPVADDPEQLLTADKVADLVYSTPWPYNVLVHVAAWTGLRARELAGLQIRDVHLSDRHGPTLTVARQVQVACSP
jgi:site-specific recombinase XerC